MKPRLLRNTGLLLAFFQFARLNTFCQSATNIPSSPSRYEARAEHDPDGIGLFYMGREVAQIMGHEGAAWLERSERQDEERPDLLMHTIKIKPGDAVADIGAGTGFYTRRLAKAVGTNGVVYAVDVQPEMIALLTNKLAELKITNVRPIIGSDSDPHLPRKSLDTILMVDVYHEFDHPWEMVHSMCNALRPGGRMIFVEFRGEDAELPIKPVHKMTIEQLRKEMAVQDLKFVEASEVLPRQHIVVFRRKD